MLLAQRLELVGIEGEMTIRVGSDDAERKVLADVEKFGWHCLNIFEEDGQPPWTFSIGFHKTWNFPELIVIGLKREVAHSTLNIVAIQLAEGRRLDLASATDELFNDFACCFVEVPKPMYREYVGTARWFHGGDAFPLYQIVWPSRDGYFPWNESASESYKQWQPVLGCPQPAVGL
jgi:hypothetical protein